MKDEVLSILFMRFLLSLRIDRMWPVCSPFNSLYEIHILYLDGKLIVVDKTFNSLYEIR